MIIEDSSASNEASKVHMDLLSYLRDHQAKIPSTGFIEQHKVTIKCEVSEESKNTPFNTIEVEDSANTVLKNYSIKSLLVDWEGKQCYMHVFIDTTAMFKLEEATNNIKLQKVMFASVSHEFRTPLNSIINSYRLAGDTFESLLHKIDIGMNLADVEAEKKLIKRFINSGTNSSMLLLSLIEDILDLSKMENGTFKTHRGEFNVRTLFDEVYELFWSQCQQKGIVLDME